MQLRVIVLIAAAALVGILGPLAADAQGSRAFPYPPTSGTVTANIGNGATPITAVLPLNTDVPLYIFVAGCCNLVTATLRRGAVWTSLRVENTNSCGCCCFGCNNGCAANMGACNPCPTRPMVTSPFLARLTDTSKAVPFDLPTRQNTPSNLPLRTTTHTITQFVDSSLLTVQMSLNITMIPREVNNIVWRANKIGKNFFCGATCSTPPPLPWRNRQPEFEDYPYERAIGIYGESEIQECTGTLNGYFWVSRRAPVPPHYTFYYGLGRSESASSTTSDRYWIPTTVATHTTGDLEAYVYNGGWTAWWNEDGCGVSNSPEWNFEYYEDVRLNRIVLNVNIAALRSQLLSQGSVVIDANHSHGVKVRFVWWNMSFTPTTNMTAHRVEASKYFGIQVVQPFPISDLWVETTDNLGVRLFTDVDRYVPYVKNTGAGCVGYQYALNTNFAVATSVTVEVKWNRRVRISTFVEETKAALVLRLARDQGGDVSKLISPIPRTIIPQGLVMGVVAKVAIANNTVAATIKLRSALTATIINQWYADTLAIKLLNYTPWMQAYVTNPSTWDKHCIVATIIVASWSASTIDRSSNWWAFTDAFYPDLPPMLPHFWDSQQLSRLLGFSEVPTRVNSDLAKWAFEYNALASFWVPFGKEVSLQRYQALRAYMIRSGHVYSGNETFFLPVVHLMRHPAASPANVDLVYDMQNGKVDLVARKPFAYLDELLPNFDATLYTKQEYLLRFGGCPDSAIDAATIPNYGPLYLYNNGGSRVNVVNSYMATFGESYKLALARLLSVMQLKMAGLPVSVDGLGTEPAIVDMITKILNAERAVLNQQIADGTVEYSLLP